MRFAGKHKRICQICRRFPILKELKGITEEHINIHRKCTTAAKLKSEPLLTEKLNLVEKLREHMLKNYGSEPYPLPKALDLGVDLQPKEKVIEELYSANIPIPQENLIQVVDFCTDHNNKTDMNEVKKILLPALGHSH